MALQTRGACSFKGVINIKRKRSEIIEDFLTLLRESDNEYSYNYNGVNKCDLLATDIQHKLEIQNLSHHKYAALAKQLATCQKERRVYKDEVEELAPILDFYEKNKQVYNSLTNLLGEVRKQEKYHVNRAYVPRVMSQEEWEE